MKYFILSMLLIMLAGGRVQATEPTPMPVTWIKNLSLAAGENEITLHWQLPEKFYFDKIILYRKQGDSLAERNLKDMEIYATLQGNISDYIDQDVVAGMLYFYAVEGVPKEPEKGRRSSVRAGMVKDLVPPGPVKDFQAKLDDNAVMTLTWKAAEESDVVSYQLYRGVENLRSLQPMLVIAADAELRAHDQVDPLSPFAFLYAVAAIDSSGNKGPMTTPVRIAVPDKRPPEKPFITALIPSLKNIQLSWSVSQSNDVQGYHIYRKNVTDGKAFQKLTKTPLAAVQFSDSTTVFGKTYSYYVTAVDQAGNESASSGALSCRAITDITIQTPVGLKLAITKENKRQLSWPGKEPSVRGYLVERSPDKLNDFRRISPLLTTTTFIDDEQTGRKQLSYRLLALYDDGRISRPSAPVIWRAAPDQETKK